MQEQRMKGPDEIFCPSCGNPVKREAVFCVHCGVPISGGQAQTTGAGQQRAKPSRDTPVFVLGLLSLVALAPLGIIGWILSAKGSRELAAGKAARSGLFTAGKVMSIIGTIVTCVLVVFWAVVLGTRLVRSSRFPQMAAPTKVSSLGADEASGQKSEPALAPPNLQDVSIDGTWYVAGDNQVYHIMGYANGDLNVTVDLADFQIDRNWPWTMTGRRQGERILIDVIGKGPLREYGDVDWYNEWHFDLKLVSPTEMTGSMVFKQPNGIYAGKVGDPMTSQSVVTFNKAP